MNKVIIYGPCSKWSEEAHTWKTEIPATLLEAQGWTKCPEHSVVFPVSKNTLAARVSGKTSKEIAKKFAFYVESYFAHYKDDDSISKIELLETIKEILKEQFDVTIKE